jgi:MFS transporter, putative metabolite:H+ symporter
MKIKTLKSLVFISAVGYAVDLFDLFLIPAFKEPMLTSLGVPTSEIAKTYLQVMNWQLLGAALGSILLWGPLADKFGRRGILLFSIMLYSLASLWTAFVNSVPELLIARGLCGLGLGAELGAAVTLVSEGATGDERTRSAKTIGFVGMLGVVAAGLLGWSGLVHWRWAFGVAGVAGLALWFVRHNLSESPLFLKNKDANQTVGHLSALKEVFFTKRFGTLFLCVLVGAPTFFVTGLLVPLAKDYAAAVGLNDLPSGPLALSCTYLFISLGDLACGRLSERIQSRKYSLLVFHFITVLGISSFLVIPATSALGFYGRCALTGFGIGYWANMTLNASEQFGTNLRGSVTVAVPNLVRLLLLPMSWLFAGAWGFAGLKLGMGFIPACMVIGFSSCVIAMAAVLCLPETYNKHLDYNEDVR